MIITQTPLRVSFLGGNTDFSEYYTKYGGMVLTTTIDKYVYCIVHKRFDDLIIVNYTIKETVEKVDDLQHELVREAMKLVGVTKGIEISFLSDIPAKGSGLGSSSSVTIGVLNALHQYKGESVGARQLAQEAVRIEVEILKKPIGIQDQYIIAFGGLRWIYFKRSGSVIVRDVNPPAIDDLANNLMLFYTGLTRKADTILSTFNVKKNVELLHQNKQLAKKGIYALRGNKIYKFGKLMDSYWEIKRRLSDKISNKEIDKMYQDAKDAGAIGGKILGAGGGGFLLLMVPENKRSMVRAKLINYKELPFRLEKTGSRVIFNI